MSVRGRSTTAASPGSYDAGCAEAQGRLFSAGLRFWRAGRYEDAERVGHIMAAREPWGSKAHALLSFTRLGAGDVEEAMRWSREAIARDPSDPHARAAYGMCLLARGEPDGWSWCRHPDLLRCLPSDMCTVPAWDGSPLEGRTICVHSHGDGGLGDVILQARFLKYLRGRGAGRVAVVLGLEHAPLQSLLAAQGFVDRVSVGGEPEPCVDVHCIFSSLAPLLSTTESVPIAEASYLAAPRHSVRDRIRNLPGLRVGIVWGTGVPAGQEQVFGRLSSRNVPLSALAPLWDISDVSWISLQKGPHAAELESLPQAQRRICDLAVELDDMAVTAAAITGCDLVVTVDTAVANLAGALGSPAWVLLHDSHDLRWFGSTPSTTYRYPSVALFRRPRHAGWEFVIAAVERALRRTLAAVDGRERAAALLRPREAGWSHTGVGMIERPPQSELLET